MVHILFGEDDFSIHEALEQIKKGLGGGEELLGNTSVLEGREATPEAITGLCSVVPFLAEKRLVIVKGFLAQADARGRNSDENASRKPANALVSFLEHMPETTVLVFLEGKLERSNPLLRELTPVSKVREFRTVRGPKLQAWLVERVAKKGGRISPGAVQLLADSVGEDLWTASNEIEKLVLYAEGRPIEDQDVLHLVSYSRQSNIFAMVDAVVQQRFAVALRLLHELIGDGAAPAYILFMVTRQARLLLRAKGLMAQGLDPKAIQARLGVSSDWAFERVVAQARAQSSERLEDLYHCLLKADAAIKTGQAPEEVVLDLFAVGTAVQG